MRQRRTVIVALILALALALSACAGGGTTATQTDDATTQGAQTPTPAAEATATPEPTEKELVTVSWALWDMANFNEEEFPTSYCFEKMGIRVEPYNLDWGTWEEQIRLMAATDTMTDCVSTYTVSNIARFYQWIDEGVIRDIPEEMIAKYQNVKAMSDNYQVLQTVKEIKGGKYWFLPRPDFVDEQLYISNRAGNYYRKDWAEKLGYKDMDKPGITIDDWYNMLMDFTTKDPDGDGANNTWGMTLEGGIGTLFNIWGTWGVDPDGWYQDEADGLYKPGYLSPDNVEALKFFQKLYQNGAIDPEFASNGYKEALAKICTHTCGFLSRNGGAWIPTTYINYFWDANKDLGDPMNYLGVMAMPQKDENTPVQLRGYIQSSGTEIAAHVDDEKLDAILAASDWLISPEGIDIQRYGFEGIDYDVVDGKRVPKQADDIPAYESYRLPGVLGNWKGGSELNTEYAANLLAPRAEAGLGFPAENYMRILDLTREYVFYNNTLYAPEITNSKVVYTFTPARDGLVLDYAARFTQMVLSSDDIETAFKQMVDEYLAKGVQTAIDEVNAIIK